MFDLIFGKERLLIVMGLLIFCVGLLFPLIVENACTLINCLASEAKSAYREWQALTASFTTLSAGILAFSGAKRQARMAREDVFLLAEKGAVQMASDLRYELDRAFDVFRTECLRFNEAPSSATSPPRCLLKPESHFRAVLNPFLSEYDRLAHLGIVFSRNLRWFLHHAHELQEAMTEAAVISADGEVTLEKESLRNALEQLDRLLTTQYYLNVAASKVAPGFLRPVNTLGEDEKYTIEDLGFASTIARQLPWPVWRQLSWPVDLIGSDTAERRSRCVGQTHYRSTGQVIHASSQNPDTDSRSGQGRHFRAFCPAH